MAPFILSLSLLVFSCSHCSHCVRMCTCVYASHLEVRPQNCTKIRTFNMMKSYSLIAGLIQLSAIIQMSFIAIELFFHQGANLGSYHTFIFLCLFSLKWFLTFSLALITLLILKQIGNLLCKILLNLGLSVSSGLDSGSLLLGRIHTNSFVFLAHHLKSSDTRLSHHC